MMLNKVLLVVFSLGLFLKSFPASAQNGRILLEYFQGINQPEISAFASNKIYNLNPSGRMMQYEFASSQSNGTDLIRGYIHPPATGNYIFTISGNGESRLSVSTDNKSVNRKVIASLDPNDNQGKREQKSETVFLEKGKTYYIEAVHVGKSAESCVAVGWTLPDGTLELPVPGKRLSPFETYTSIPDFKNIAFAQDHPRIQATSRDYLRIRAYINQNAKADSCFKILKKSGRRALKEPVSGYAFKDNSLLHVSRKVLDRTNLLTFLYHFEKDSTERKLFAERAWKELESAANFQDWNPGHFLDVAEMTHALALGYDRLYNYLTEGQRKILRNAIKEKGLRPFIDQHLRKAWWTDKKHNWNMVCNSGALMGALAIGDEIGAMTDTVLSLGVNSIFNNSLRQFSPDGGWNEGPMYWSYTTKYLCAVLSGFETTFGGDFGLGSAPGVSQTGYFPMQLLSPASQLFNFGDGGNTIKHIDSYSMLFLAFKFNNDAYSWFQEDVMKGINPYNFIWFPYGRSKIKDVENHKLSRDMEFKNIGVVAMRCSRTGVYAGFKAGSNKVNHSHHDIGTFVFDALGYRWAEDLGGDKYSLPGYFGKQRTTYYRIRSEGQNTLVINPGESSGQNRAGEGRIISTKFHVASPEVTADLTDAYISEAKKVTRRLVLVDRKKLLIEDHISGNKVSDVWWFMHTKAAIEISQDGKSATLMQGGKRVKATITAGPADVRFSAMDAKPLPTSPDPENQNPNLHIRKLAIKVSGMQEVSLSVMLTPL